MNAVTIPADLKAWAEAEVAAGWAETVEQVTERALRGYRAQIEQLRQLLDEARAELQSGGGHSMDDVFAELLAAFPDEPSDKRRWDVVHASLKRELAEARAGRVLSADDVFADLKSRYADQV